jgi:hypothetical protein
MMTRHTHCLSPGVALTLLILSAAAGKMGWIQPFGIRLDRLEGLGANLPNRCDFAPALRCHVSS